MDIKVGEYLISRDMGGEISHTFKVLAVDGSSSELDKVIYEVVLEEVK